MRGPEEWQPRGWRTWSARRRSTGCWPTPSGRDAVDGPGGLLKQLTRTVLERALGAELDDHLGYVTGDPAGHGSGNSRNGSYAKTVTTAAGPVRSGVPRDREAASSR